MAAITFDYSYWTAGYPEFAGCSPAQGQFWFDQAGLYCANVNCSPAFGTDGTVLKQLLYLLTSHIAWMNAPRDANGNPAATGQPASAIVGRISSASEGSVSVQAEWKGSGSPSEDWYTQTKYGAAYWAATAQFRTFRYGARPTIVAVGPWPFPGGVWGNGSLN